MREMRCPFCGKRPVSIECEECNTEMCNRCCKQGLCPDCLSEAQEEDEFYGDLQRKKSVPLQKVRQGGDDGRERSVFRVLSRRV